MKIVALGRRLQGPPGRLPDRLAEQHPDTATVADGPLLRRPRRLQEGHRHRRQLRHPGHAARLPADAHRRRPSRPARTSSPRSPWRSTAPASARCSSAYEDAKEKKLAHRRRHAVPALRSGYIAVDEADPRRRDRRASPARVLLEPGRACGSATAQPAGATWSTRCATGCTSPGSPATTSSSRHVHNIDVLNWAFNGHPVKAHRHWRPPGPHRAGVRPHLRSLRHRLRVPGRHVRDHDVPAAERLRQEGRQRVHRHQAAPPTSCRTTSSRAPTPWKYSAPEPNDMYVQEHTDLIAASAPASRSTSSSRWPRAR